MVFPDRTPSPGLLEYAKVIAPVRIGPGPEPDTLTVENRYEVLDLSHLRSVHLVAGPRRGRAGPGVLPTPELAAGEHGRLPLPRPDPPPATAGGCTRGGTADWAPRGHVVAWGQLRRSATGRRPPIGPPGPARSEGEHILLGAGRLDGTTGALLCIGELPSADGLGTAAVGPGVLPQYRLAFAPEDCAFFLTPLQRS
ncbi:beta-galactosidase domain 4-containing protein [Streptomyces katrae]|uniref:beta-galactosidase domain 4-containing protein n=1 Tax=Streptomyces katrae TaxID=68223 RepID=UPI0004C08E84|nr:beta-galactosidase domain 4-containing protein [Streptomyces katrae]